MSKGFGLFIFHDLNGEIYFRSCQFINPEKKKVD